MRLVGSIGTFSWFRTRALLSKTIYVRVQGLGTLLTVNAFCGWLSNARRLAELQCDSHCQANEAHIRQARPNSGLDFQAKVLATFQVVPFALGSGDFESVRLFN